MSESGEVIKLEQDANEKPLLVGIALHVFNHIEFDHYFNHLYCVARWGTQFPIVLLGVKGLDSAKSREKIIEQALNVKCTHVLFIDGDHFIPEEMLRCFMDSKDEAIVSGVVCKKGEGYPQVAWLKDDKGNRYSAVTVPLDGKLYEVGVCAFGCTLLNLEWVQRLKKPHFRDTCEPDGSGELSNIRSDVNICNALRNIGGKVWVDSRVLIGHAGYSRVVYPQNAKVMDRVDQFEIENRQLRKGQEGFYYEVPFL